MVQYNILHLHPNIYIFIYFVLYLMNVKAAKPRQLTRPLDNVVNVEG